MMKNTAKSRYSSTISRTREYVRGLLTEHGVLPRRDELRKRYENWATKAIERTTDPQNRELIRRYVRWHHQRRMNHMEEVTRGTFLRAKQQVTVAIDLLNWLTDHGITLMDLTQAHLDVWQAGGRSARRIAEGFLKWAIKTKAAPAGLAIVPHRRGTSARLAKTGQNEALNCVVHTDGLEARDRAAAILILVFGQQAENIARLTWDDVTVTEELVTVQLGTIHDLRDRTGESAQLWVWLNWPRRAGSNLLGFALPDWARSVLPSGPTGRSLPRSASPCP
ncbi:hypothetical protein [Arthrobacter sp. ISL-5]|uniref:hypothetical protein n=1 Tax=Arthrobacter sp. ISL-5 TaxID=2819111 RepID=UPI001BEA070B|nr:hypothetical protein [Arthrobacter sp. ISL-5]MBT2554153.1 hypothetical protein [Arthrobacter sp. ISL-5]